jgi:chromosome segregation ATPase
VQFLPTTLDGWLGLISAAAAVIGMAFTLIYKISVKPLADNVDRHFADQGTRIGALESQFASTGAKVDKLDRESERLHLQISTIFEQSGRMETRLQGLDNTLQRFHEERLAEDRRAGERLVAIETKMDVFAKLDATLNNLSARIKVANGER